MKDMLAKSWLYAFMIAGPISGLMWAISIVSYTVEGDAAIVMFLLFFGWIVAAIWAAVVAIPLGIIFMGFGLVYTACRAWWQALPFTVSRK